MYGVDLAWEVEASQSYSAVKKSIWKAVLPTLDRLLEDLLEDNAISFHKNEATILWRPHDDVLVISLPITNYQVGRILVDNGSSADVKFLATLEEIDISKD